jgi:hypothetical protein
MGGRLWRGARCTDSHPYYKPLERKEAILQNGLLQRQKRLGSKPFECLGLHAGLGKALRISEHEIRSVLKPKIIRVQQHLRDVD